MLKNERGITLVALVITIIILIILATVAISFAFGNNNSSKEDYSANSTRYTDDSIANLQTYLEGIIANPTITQ